MAEFKNRCRLYFQFPAQPSAKLEAQLAQAITSADAACVLLCGEGEPVDEIHARHLVDFVQGRGLACLVETDAGLAARLGADGVHIDADPRIYAEARKRLGETASIGAACGFSRHDAMLLAELGADYIAFGPKAAQGSIDAIDQPADLIAWWSEIFVVPCVAWNVDSAEEAARFAALGADFIAPSSRIWRNAVRHVRRAA
jgi:thiamine-phosphate pyrophosphorylase